MNLELSYVYMYMLHACACKEPPAVSALLTGYGHLIPMWLIISGHHKRSLIPYTLTLCMCVNDTVEPVYMWWSPMSGCNGELGIGRCFSKRCLWSCAILGDWSKWLWDLKEVRSDHYYIQFQLYDGLIAPLPPPPSPPKYNNVNTTSYYYDCACIPPLICGCKPYRYSCAQFLVESVQVHLHCITEVRRPLLIRPCTRRMFPAPAVCP